MKLQPCSPTTGASADSSNRPPAPSTKSYQHVSPQHLKRYTGEFDFRYNTRDQSDFERATLAAKGIQGKRLTYRRTGEAGHA